MTQSEHPEGSNPRSPNVGFHTLMTIAALVVVIAGLKAAQSIILPVLLAGFLAVLSAPPIAWLVRHRVPKWAAVIVVFVGVLAAFGLVSLFIGTSINDFTQNLPTYRERIGDQLNALSPLLAWAGQYGVEVSTDQIVGYLNAGRVMTWFGNALSTVSSVLSDVLFVLLTTIFIIAEAAGLPTKLKVAMGDPNADMSRFSNVLSDLQGYLGIKTQISLITGFLAGLLCWIAGVDYAFLWGLVAFLLNFIPTLGSIMAAAPSVALALIQFGWQRAIVVLVGYLAINMVMGNVIEPRMMGKRLGLSTLVVFLSLVFWGFVFGPTGMLLCVPLTMLVKILLQNSDDLRWVAVLLGSGAEMRAQRSTMVPPQPPKNYDQPDEE